MNNIKMWWHELDEDVRRKLVKLAKIIGIITAIIAVPGLIVNLVAIAVAGIGILIIVSPILLIGAILVGIVTLIWKIL